MNRQEFLDGRQIGIGSSDVAKIIGLSKWGTALDVYLDKTRPLVAGKLSPPLEWGHRLEPAIAGAIIDHFGWELRKVPTVIHREHRYLIASVDRLTSAEGPNDVVEIKSTSVAEGWGEPETAEIPTHYWVQVQHQMEVLHETYGTELAWVFVLIGQSDFRRYRVPRDPDYLETVIEPLTEFWSRVQSRTPPEPDWSHASTLDAIQRLYRPTAGQSVELTPYGQSLVEEYARLGEEVGAATKRRDEAKARIIAEMGDAESATMPDGRIVQRKVVERAGYTVKPASYVDFRIKKGRQS